MFLLVLIVQAFAVVLGLSLDYDVFLLGRILEYRLMGYDDIKSLELGLRSTGNIITYLKLWKKYGWFLRANMFWR